MFARLLMCAGLIMLGFALGTYCSVGRYYITTGSTGVTSHVLSKTFMLDRLTGAVWVYDTEFKPPCFRKVCKKIYPYKGNSIFDIQIPEKE